MINLDKIENTPTKELDSYHQEKCLKMDELKESEILTLIKIEQELQNRGVEGYAFS